MCVCGEWSGVEGVKAGGIREGFVKDVTFEQGLRYSGFRTVAMTGEAFRWREQNEQRHGGKVLLGKCKMYKHTNIKQKSIGDLKTHKLV